MYDAFIGGIRSFVQSIVNVSYSLNLTLILISLLNLLV